LADLVRRNQVKPLLYAKAVPFLAGGRNDSEKTEMNNIYSMVLEYRAGWPLLAPPEKRSSARPVTA
jgi:hypothetical protein